MNVSQTLCWRDLQTHAARLAKQPVDFTDTARLDKYDIACHGLRLNYAFQNIDEHGLNLLCTLAEQQKVTDWLDRMFAGDKINNTENRAVLHTALRRTGHAPLLVDGGDIMPQIRTTQKRIADFVDAVRNGIWRGTSGKTIRHVVNIGIGGSDLGPRLAVQALQKYTDKIVTHFVANIDAFDLQNTLSKIDAAETLFVVVSKTFTTQETLLNAQSARRWLVAQLGEAAVAKHFVAVSVNQTAVGQLGITDDNMFPLWDWVGGRYSLWSAVGLSIALAIGNDNFRDLLAGAAAMDEHFQSAPLEKNMPVILALLGIWNRNFLGASSLAILPYSERLRDLPRYLQQLDMESNGKSVTRDGHKIDYATAPVIFGDCGSVGQHSFHQWLHQGSDAIATDFIGIAADDMKRPDHHRGLLANMAAQMTALAFGQSHAALPHDIYPGARPSNLIMLDRLDPFHLGMLLALYEHKIFVQGVLWEINSFDQPGVELGKQMARSLDAPPSTPQAHMTDMLFKSMLR